MKTRVCLKYFVNDCSTLYTIVVNLFVAPDLCFPGFHVAHTRRSSLIPNLFTIYGNFKALSFKIVSEIFLFAVFFPELVSII